MELQIRLLGAVEAHDGDAIDLRGPRQRRLLAVLALRAGSLVSVNEVVDAVWADGDFPTDVRKTLPTYISRLRRSLGDSAFVVGRDGGYLLDIDPMSVDAVRFEAVCNDAIRNRTDRINTLGAALRWFGGPALAGFEHEDWARPHATRLEALRQLATDEFADALIEDDRHDEAIPILESAVASQPLHERTQRLLMIAMHRSGRSGEALRVYQAFRRRLATDLGLDPSEEIRRLEQSIVTASSVDIDKSFGRADASQLHAYQLHERIGVGAFAMVYRGTQPSVGREVAIKQIRAELANRPDFIRRFETEAHLVARLEHPHIVPLYDYWREPGSAYLVMRWLRGGSLSDVLADGRFELERAIKAVSQIGAALSFAHRSGVIHRDVKSANILLDEMGNAYLSDFGIAHEAVVTRQAVESMSIGSPAYASPEQLRREVVGPPADVYGLGIVVFELLTGRLPYADAADHAAMVAHQLNDPLPSILTARPDLPPSIDDMLARATAKEPSDRYTTPDDFVSQLQTLTHSGPRVARRTATATQVAELAGVNPYKGLRSFDEADAADFFGRERLVRSITQRMNATDGCSRIVTLVGPSGSGKSSLVRAALLPALRNGAVAGSDRWFMTTMVPGASPYEELAAALRRVATDEHPGLATMLRADRRGIVRGVRRVMPDSNVGLLLVIDQFEELFTQVADETERARFIETLGEAVTATGSQLRVVATLRADFYDRPLRYAAIAQLVSDSTITITPLAPEELEMAITYPAQRVGARFAPGLVAEIIADVGTQPGALPLLQYALTALYEHRQDETLQLGQYRDMGGLTGAIAAKAEELYVGALPQTQVATRRLMLRLVTLGEGTEDTRRRVRRAELGADDDTTAVIEAFGNARLLSFDRDPADREPTVEVAHEALLRQWPRLREWLTDGRAGLRIHRQITTAAASWLANKRDDGDLLRGARLIASEDWKQTHQHDLNEIESAFLDASVAARDASVAEEQVRYERQARQNRRLRRLFVAASITAVVALLAGALALRERQRSSDRAETARAAAFHSETSRIASDAAQIVGTNPRVALLLAAEAYRREPGPETLGALQRVLTHTGPLLGFIGGGARYAAVTWIDEHTLVAARSGAIDIFSDDGNLRRSVPFAGTRVLAADERTGRLAAGSQDSVALVDAGTGSIKRVAVGELVQALAYSPDGAVLAIGTRSGALIAVDAESGSPRYRITAHPEGTLAELALPHTVVETVPHLPASAIRGVNAIAFDPDGTRVATGGFGYARLWDITTSRLVAQASLVANVGSETVVRTALAIGFADIAGAVRVLVADDETLWTLDPFTATQLSQTTTFDRGSYFLRRDAFVPVAISQGKLLEGYSDTVAYFRSLDGSAADLELRHGTGDATGVAIAPGARKAAISGDDGLAVLSLTYEGLLAVSTPPLPGSSAEVNVAIDGRTIAVSSASRDSSLWRLTERGFVRLPLPEAEPLFIFLPGGFDEFAGRGTPISLLVDRNRGVALIDTATGGLIRWVPDWDVGKGAYGEVFETQNFYVLVAEDGLIEIRSLGDDSVLHRFTELRDALDKSTGKPAYFGGSIAAFDPSFRTLMGMISGVGTVYRWDLETGKAERLADLTGISGGFQLTPDRTLLATSDAQGNVALRDATTFQPTGRTFLSNRAAAGEHIVRFSANGRLMMTVGDGKAQLWDFASGVRIGDVFPADDSWTGSPSGDVRWLATVVDGRVIRWDLDVDAWPAIACRAAGRNLTQAEWDLYGPRNSSYATTCSLYPSLEKEKVPS